MLKGRSSDLSRVTPGRHVTFGNNFPIRVLIIRGCLADPAKTKHNRREICDLTDGPDNDTRRLPLPQKKSFTPPVIIVPENIREEVTKPDGAQVSFPVSFFIIFSKLNYWCREQMRIQKSESLQKLKSGSS